MVLDGKSSQEYPANAGIPQGSIIDPKLFLLYNNDLPDDCICNIAIYTNDTALYSKGNQASDLWQQLELSSELQAETWVKIIFFFRGGLGGEGVVNSWGFRTFTDSNYKFYFTTLI